VTDLARKLNDLFIAEVSGVDHPANQLDGWLLMKQKQKDAVQETLDAIGRPIAATDQPGLALPWKHWTNTFAGSTTLDLGAKP
jgi:hypothetical protein